MIATYHTQPAAYKPAKPKHKHTEPHRQNKTSKPYTSKNTKTHGQKHSERDTQRNTETNNTTKTQRHQDRRTTTLDTNLPCTTNDYFHCLVFRSDCLSGVHFGRTHRILHTKRFKFPVQRCSIHFHKFCCTGNISAKSR